MNIVQIICLILFKNYILYLLLQVGFQLAQKIYMSLYINNKYAYLKDKKIDQLDEEEKKNIFKNVRALMFHKIGEISVNQTDNIIISAFINVMTVGMVSNYVLIASTVNTFVNVIFNGMAGSLGNLFATEGKEKQFRIFKVMDFVGFWIFSFSSVAMLALVQPFISLMWGEQYTLSMVVVSLFVLNNYMVGLRISVNNIKVAGGIFDQDKYLAIIQSIVNLFISVVLAQKVGLSGVYIGTIVSGLIPSLIRPYIVYKHLLERKAIQYYMSFLGRMILTATLAMICCVVSNRIMVVMTWKAFFLDVIVIGTLPNIIYCVLYWRTEEFKYLFKLVRKFLGR